jgi:voltage-gated potassium channel
MENSSESWREKWRHIIFGTNTPKGQLFDKTLIALILASVACVMLDSVPAYRLQFGQYLYSLEWFFTIIFTLEYIFRLIVSKKPLSYMLSFYGFVDILSILPSFISLFFPGAQYLSIIRLLRVLRIFRVLKLLEYMGEARMLTLALQKSRKKILVFMYSVTVLAVIFGSLMYLIEGAENGFSSIPRSIYWAIVTITTVGYGDISPNTPLGQALASLAMLTGYAIIAIPTGIITAEIALLSQMQQRQAQEFDTECPECHKHVHARGAKFCDHCGHNIENKEEDAAV